MLPAMSDHWIDPVAFRLGHLAIRWYGVWVAAGFLAAVAHWTRLARWEGRRGGFGADFGVLVMVSGIAGSRLAYALSNPSEFLSDPINLVRINRGGLVFYGGFLLAVAAVWIMARIRRESYLGLLDFGVTGLALGHAFGRIGCFFNGCCYGIPAGAPWSCWSHGALRQPVQLFEAAFNLALWLLLTRTYRRRPPHGVVFACYLVSYGAWRFVAEFIRGDDRAFWLGWPVAQWISLALMAAGWALALRVRRPAA